MIQLSDAHIAVLEDDKEMLDALVERISYDVSAVYPFENIDEAEDCLSGEKKAGVIHAYLIDIMLPIPEKVKLPPDTQDIDAGLVYHEMLEQRLNAKLPTVFFTGATRDNPEMEKRVKEYVSKDPAHREYVPKPANAEQLVQKLSEVLKSR